MGLVDGVFWVVNELLNLYWWAILIAAVLGNLLAFGVLDRRSRFVWNLNEFFYRVTEPALRPLRQVVPSFGGVDITPILVLLIIVFLQRFALPELLGAIGGSCRAAGLC